MMASDEDLYCYHNSGIKALERDAPKANIIESTAPVSWRMIQQPPA